MVSQSDYVRETKFLMKNYRVWLRSYLAETESGTADFHIHPPPAFKALYDHLIDGLEIGEDGCVDVDELVAVFDIVARFMSHLHMHHISYEGFTGCPCITITDDDMALLNN